MNVRNSNPSITEVAKSIITPATPAQPQEGEEKRPNAQTDAPVGATQEVEEAVEPQEFEEQQEGEELLDDNAQEEDLEGDDTDADEGIDGQENSDLLELADDTTFFVTVDEQEVEVTLADLKKAYAGEGAIAKRLQEATEARKAVEAERNVVKQELETGRAKLVQAFQTFDTLMFQPRVNKPDASLQNSDPQRYLLQMEAYRQDQSTIQQRRQQVQGALQKYEQQQKEVEQTERADNARKLVEVLPDLAHPEKGKALSEKIVKAATTYYGFSQAEIGAAYDYRVFQMAADAAAYRDLIAKQSATRENVVPKTKVLKPGTVNTGKRTAGSRKQAQAHQRARQTGDVKDVAQTMILK